MKLRYFAHITEGAVQLLPGAVGGPFAAHAAEAARSTQSGSASRRLHTRYLLLRQAACRAIRTQAGPRRSSGD
jgi:hypothetical protein